MSKTMTQDLQRVWTLMEPERRNYAWGILALTLVNIMDVAAPIFLAVAVDLTKALLTGKVPQTPPVLSMMGFKTAHFTMTGAVVLFVSCHAISNLSRYPMLMLVAVPSHRLGQILRNSIVDKLLLLSQPFYDRSKSGDLMSRATTDVTAARMMLGPGVLVGADTVMILSLVVLLLFSLSWKLTLIALLPLPMIGYITNKLSHAEYNRFDAVQSHMSKLTERTRESYSGMRILQAYAREPFDAERFEAASWRHFVKNISLAKVRAAFDPILFFMLGISTVLILVFGGLQVLDGTISLGTFVAFLFLVGYLAGPMMGLGWAVSLFQRGRASLSRIDTLLEEEVEITSPASPKKVGGLGQLEIRDLTFAYKQPPPKKEDEENDTIVPAREHALEGISLSLNAGQTLGVIGAVGSGKTTLVNLLVRLYDPPEGTVFLDGKDIRELQLQELRRQIIMAPQDTFLFSDTVERNIALGSVDDGFEASKYTGLAQLHEEVEQLTEGYQTMLGERGVNLSGGQRQRLAIARAIATDPPVLILDDCLSAVDARTEEAILKNLRTVFDGRTGIIVSHRVIAVKDCDHILVLQDGKVAEEGSHKELLLKNGYYATIARQQTEEDS